MDKRLMTSKAKYTYIPYKPDGSGVFYPERPDGFPDAMYQFPKLNHTMELLLWRYDDRPDVLVSGNNAIYYEQGNPRVHRSPDGFIAFGVDRDAILQENGYKVWEVGKPPDWVLEIASPSTARVDLTIKRDIYASLGIGEYWRFDASGGDYYREPLVGEYLEGGEYRRFETRTSADGRAWGHSPVLNLDIYWGPDYLRYYDPVAGEWLLDWGQQNAELEVERAARLEAERRYRELQDELHRRNGT